MKGPRVGVAVSCAAVLFAVALLLAAPAARAESRSSAVTEERVALVIGNAAYRSVSPLPNPVNDARLIAATLQKADFKVTLREDLDRAGLVNALREFGNRMNDRTIALFYYAGHGLQLRDRNYLVPVDAEIRSEDEIPIAGVDLGFILGRMSFARSRVNIVILDACRDNPFAQSTGPAARGLAQMDAPVGTLLAYATAPGKVADDGEGPHSLYSAQLAKAMLAPGLPVELMFKRVREAVVRSARIPQVPWESSSLQGEFAFVPGVTTAADTDDENDVAAEVAFWNSVQSAQRADEYRAYLRQYPRGRFAALAQTRIAAFTTAPAVSDVAAAPAPSSPAAPPGAKAPASAADLLPRPGDTWRYRVQDQFRIGDLFMTARVDEVTASGIAETWTTTSDAKVRTTVASLEPRFNELPSWTLTPPEFAPYLQGAGALSAQRIRSVQMRVGEMLVPMTASVEGEEEIAVAAGRFRAIKLVLRGQVQARGARSGPVAAEHVVWYARDAKRIVKYTVSARVGGSLQEATSVELMEYKLN
jgi:uncharacterized caspase-like protein